MGSVDELLGQLKLVLAGLDVCAVEPLDVILLKNGRHQLERGELFGDLIEKVLIEDAGVITSQAEPGYVGGTRLNLGSAGAGTGSGFPPGSVPSTENVPSIAASTLPPVYGGGTKARADRRPATTPTPIATEMRTRVTATRDRHTTAS